MNISQVKSRQSRKVVLETVEKGTVFSNMNDTKLVLLSKTNTLLSCRIWWNVNQLMTSALYFPNHQITPKRKTYSKTLILEMGLWFGLLGTGQEAPLSLLGLSPI